MICLLQFLCKFNFVRTLIQILMQNPQNSRFMRTWLLRTSGYRSLRLLSKTLRTTFKFSTEYLVFGLTFLASTFSILDRTSLFTVSHKPLNCRLIWMIISNTEISNFAICCSQRSAIFIIGFNNFNALFCRVHQSTWQMSKVTQKRYWYLEVTFWRSFIIYHRRGCCAFSPY